jgi:CRP-like cAMP-binding protein
MESPSFGDLGSGKTFTQVPREVKVLLHTLPFFSGLSQSEDFIDDISKTLQFRKFQTGDIVIRQGEAARAMFFIIKGTLKVISEDGEIDLAELTSGSYCKHYKNNNILVGEIGILFDVKRTATVVAKTSCTLLSLTSENVSEELAAYPEIALRVRENAHGRLVALAQEYEKNGKKLSTDISRQIQEFGVKAVRVTELILGYTPAFR